MLQVDWQVGENTVTSVTGYSQYEFDELCDCDFTGANVFNVAMAEDFDQTSQEIRLTSPTGGKLEYILGALLRDLGPGVLRLDSGACQQRARGRC